MRSPRIGAAASHTRGVAMHCGSWRIDQRSARCIPCRPRHAPARQRGLHVHHAHRRRLPAALRQSTAAQRPAAGAHAVARLGCSPPRASQRRGCSKCCSRAAAAAAAAAASALSSTQARRRACCSASRTLRARRSACEHCCSHWWPLESFRRSRCCACLRIQASSDAGVNSSSR
jgi:hypothetical protein